MLLSKFENIRVAGVAGAVPHDKVVNAEAHDYMSDEDKQKVVALTGVEEYRRANDATCASDLCASAARQLLEGMQVDATEIDALIFVSMTPDYRIPSTACILQDRLGCSTSIIAFDVNMGCSGYVVGLYTILSLMQGAGLRKALLLTGDTQTKLCYPRDKNVSFILADGGTATLLERDEGAAPITIGLNTDGGRFENLYIPAGGFRNMSNHATAEVTERPDGGLRADDHLFMNGMEIFKFSATDVVESLTSFMQQGELTPADIDCLYMHQANKFMLDKIAAKMKFSPDKVPFSIHKYGNTGSASIPLTIAHHLSANSGAKSGRNLLCGFGVGLSWGVVDIEFDDVYVPPIVDVDAGSQSAAAGRGHDAAIIFPGQGAQSVGMGKQLFERHEETRTLFARASRILDIDLAKLCFEGPESELAKTQYVQPAVTVVNIAALGATLKAGITPIATGGHSLGEYSALYAAGAITLDDTLTLVAERGRQMQLAADKAPGGMLAILGMSIDQVRAAFATILDAGDVQIANHNSLSQVILTGRSDALESIQGSAQDAGAEAAFPLNVSGPWHSRFMAPASDAMRAVLDRTPISDPTIPVVCNVTGKLYKDANEIRTRLIDQITTPVEWLACMHTMIQTAPDLPVLECGPGSTLAGLLRDIDASVEVTSIDQLGGDAERLLG